jgi:hypothetical protein
VNLKRVLQDRRARPDAAYQFILGDELAGRTGQNLDDFEGSSAKGHGSAANPELAPCEIDLALAIGEDWLTGAPTHPARHDSCFFRILQKHGDDKGMGAVTCGGGDRVWRGCCADRQDRPVP